MERSLGDKIADEAEANSEESSKLECLKYVRIAVQRGMGIPEVPTGIASAKDSAPYFLSKGYE